jgi:hypothetical protein
MNLHETKEVRDGEEPFANTGVDEFVEPETQS